MSYVHFMFSRTIVRRAKSGGVFLRNEWITAVEQPELVQNNQVAKFVVPLRDGCFASSYSIDMVVQNHTGTITGHLERDDWEDIFHIRIGNSLVTFRPTGIKAPYGGILIHPDFSHRLISLQPEPNDLDLVFDRYGVTFIGVNPWRRYGGIEAAYALA